MTSDILIQILARTDAAWSPYRRSDSASRGTVTVLRQRYPDSGVAWTPPKTFQAADRKRFQRQIDDAIGEGLVTVHSPPGQSVKTTSVKLTTRGETIARLLAALPIMPDTIPWLDRLCALQDHPKAIGKTVGEKYVSEAVMIGVDVFCCSMSGMFWNLEEIMRPMLVSQLVTSNDDGASRVAYCPTPAGHQLVRERAEQIEANGAWQNGQPRAEPKDSPNRKREGVLAWQAERDEFGRKVSSPESIAYSKLIWTAWEEIDSLELVGDGAREIGQPHLPASFF